jgi:transposase InsO family protein
VLCHRDGAVLTLNPQSRPLHGVPKKIVSDRGTQFTSRFGETLYEALDIQLRFNSAYHPQTDGQTKRVNQILEDMLRVCAL